LGHLVKHDAGRCEHPEQLGEADARPRGVHLDRVARRALTQRRLERPRLPRERRGTDVRGEPLQCVREPLGDVERALVESR
jgi:hypothetical protein